MRTYLLGFLIYPSLILCQIDTTSLSYYPLNTGNKWQFLVEIRQFGQYQEFYKVLEVIGDTLLANGNTYKIIRQTGSNSPNIGYRFERIDTTNLTVSRYHILTNQDYQYYKLDAVLGDTVIQWYSPYVCIDIGTTQIFNITKKSKLFNRVMGGLESEAYRLCEDLGYIDYYYYYPEYRRDENLIYAKINGVEYGAFVSIINLNKTEPNLFYLSQNYPNPFNPSTKIRFEISFTSYMSLKIFNMLGEEVEQLVSQKFLPGSYEFIWDAHSLPNGIYFYQLKAGKFSQTKKALLLK